MAGDWIKMRTNLWDDPRVTRLCDLTDQGEAAVIGGLYWLWAMADQHTEEGFLPGLTPRAIDRKTGVPGLGGALIEIGWVEEQDGGLRIVSFEEHNGASAKKRCTTAKRVANHRSGNGDVTHGALQQSNYGVTGALAREEKSREEVSPSLRSGDGAQVAPTTKRGSRLDPGWVLPKAWSDWALEKYPHWTEQIVRDEALKFRNHWHAATGKSATKLDWYGTWQNWCMSDIAQRANPMPQASIASVTAPSKAADETQAYLEKLAAETRAAREAHARRKAALEQGQPKGELA